MPCPSTRLAIAVEGVLGPESLICSIEHHSPGAIVIAGRSWFRAEGVGRRSLNAARAPSSTYWGTGSRRLQQAKLACIVRPGDLANAQTKAEAHQMWVSPGLMAFRLESERGTVEEMARLPSKVAVLILDPRRPRVSDPVAPEALARRSSAPFRSPRASRLSIQGLLVDVSIQTIGQGLKPLLNSIASPYGDGCCLQVAEQRAGSRPDASEAQRALGCLGVFLPKLAATHDLPGDATGRQEKDSRQSPVRSNSHQPVREPVQRLMADRQRPPLLRAVFDFAS